MTRRRRRRQTLRRYHRWLGIGLTLPLILLAVTGFLLNHSDDLALDTRFAAQPWLASLYGVDPKAPKTGYPVAGRWVSQARDTLFLNSDALASSDRSLVGAAVYNELLIVANADALHLFTADGRSIDRLALPADHESIRGLAVAPRRVLVRTATGVLATDADMTRWIETGDQPWPGGVARQPLPQPLRAAIRRQLLASTLSWERVLLELHSGRILGPAGPWLVDIAAIVIVLLAGTGGIIWTRVAFRRGPK